MNERESKTDLGLIRIRDEVISSIASSAAKEVKGVAATVESVYNKVFNLITKRNLSKGVRVEINKDGEVKLSISIIAEYGANIPRVATEVQERIKSSLAKMTGLSSIEVDVNVQGVNPPPKAASEISEKGEKK